MKCTFNFKECASLSKLRIIKLGFFFSKRCCKSLANYRFSSSDGFCASKNNLGLYIKVYVSLVVFSHLEFNKRSDREQKKLIWIFLPGAITLEQL